MCTSMKPRFRALRTTTPADMNVREQGVDVKEVRRTGYTRRLN
jgi:hypothetical protein